MKLVYMLTTDDEYELPVFTAETVKELAELSGISRYTLSAGLHRGRKVHGRGHVKYRIFRVEVENE